MKVESIAECSKGSILQFFYLHLVKIGIENQFLVFLRVAVLDRFYCIAVICHENVFTFLQTVSVRRSPCRIFLSYQASARQMICI